jgi:signal transduction histidine kinase
MPVDVTKLLSMYKAGRHPALDELVNGDLLTIFQRGAMKKTVSSFGLLLPVPGSREEDDDRWLYGEFINTGFHWSRHCAALRTWEDKHRDRIYDDACKGFDRTKAIEAARLREPIVYLCHGGMVDCALPIVVDGLTVAVLFAGQDSPAGGLIWSREFVEDFATCGSVAGSCDAREESMRRNKQIMAQMEVDNPEVPLPSLDKYAAQARQVTPAEIPTVLQDMKETSRHLSLLAEQTIGYQLSIIRSYFTCEVARLLPETDDKFWGGLSDLLNSLADFYERDYALFYMLKRSTDDFMVACTRVKERFLVGEPPKISRQNFFPLRSKEPCLPIMLKPAEAKKDLLFDSEVLFDSPCYVIPLQTNGPLGIVVMGNFKRKRTHELSERELVLIKEQFQDISIVLENRRQLLARDMYVTDLAHEVKSPLAAVLAVAENLASSRIETGQIATKANEMLARLRRLQLNVDRFGMLEKLLSNPDSLKPKGVPIYDVAKECETDYREFAEERGIGIVVSKELAELPLIYSNRDALKHALGNLIHNAVKYGDGGTNVIVEGRSVGSDVKVDVRDIGIPIQPADRALLGQRNFRSNEARKRDPSGTGIGFTIVDRFLKLTGGRFEVDSFKYHSGSYHVIISMFLPKYGGPQWQKY